MSAANSPCGKVIAAIDGIQAERAAFPISRWTVKSTSDGLRKQLNEYHRGAKISVNDFADEAPLGHRPAPNTGGPNASWDERPHFACTKNIDVSWPSQPAAGVLAELRDH